MTEEQLPKNTPIKNLEELRKLLDTAEEVIVDANGALHHPSDPGIAKTPPQNRTALKPQRWFANRARGGQID